jgi:hypothetical protein
MQPSDDATRGGFGSGIERRKSARYTVTGSWFLDVSGRIYDGVPLNVGPGGLLLQADPIPPDGTCGTLRLQVAGFDETIVAEVRVIRTLGRTAAAVLLTPSDALLKCLAMLAAQGSAG